MHKEAVKFDRLVFELRKWTDKHTVNGVDLTGLLGTRLEDFRPPDPQSSFMSPQ